MIEKIKRAEETFKVLGNQSRIKILLEIAQGEKCVHEIAETIDQSFSNVSHHLKNLRDNRLVDYRKEGRHKYYQITDDHVLNILKECIRHAEE
ncbi:MAG: ArsR/SmtB family transcription factor [Candidatus Acetothermia bacterium]